MYSEDQAKVFWPWPQGSLVWGLLLCWTNAVYCSSSKWAVTYVNPPGNYASNICRRWWAIIVSGCLWAQARYGYLGNSHLWNKSTFLGHRRATSCRLVSFCFYLKQNSMKKAPTNSHMKTLSTQCLWTWYVREASAGRRVVTLENILVINHHLVFNWVHISSSWKLHSVQRMR